MDQRPSKVILAQMTPRKRLTWPQQQKTPQKRLLRNTAFLAAVSLCMGLYAWTAVTEPQKAEAVMNHLTAGFEYDETLGRLHLVSNMLPESAMVFLNANDVVTEFQPPIHSSVLHAWTQQEPWIEYSGIGDVAACEAGEIAAIVKNHAGSYTVRLLHSNGYESVYSGLSAVQVSEYDRISGGGIIGTARGNTAFELRKDGVSVLPAFAER